PDTIYFKDTASRFTRINAAQARTLGLKDPRQAIGKTDADFFTSETAAASLAAEQRLLQTGESIIDQREFNPMPDGRARWFSSTKMPVRGTGGKIIGLVGISRDITERISNEQSATAERAQLAQRVEHMALVIELSEQLQACAVDTEVYQVAARLAGRLFPGALGALYAIDPRQESVTTVATWGTPALDSQVFELDDCWALRRAKPHYWGGEHAGELCPHVRGDPPAFTACLPLSAAGERLGILHLRSGPGVEARAFGDVQMQSALLTGDSLALAWANVRLRESLHEQAVRDPLTGLYNRRHMQASFERELRRAERNDKPIGIIMVDIDHFKEINDTYGHDAGDLVLRELGRFLREHTRAGDIACRLGGEEFIIILPEANLEQTRRRAEKHREQFAAELINYDGRKIDTPTLSVGVAAYPLNGKTTEDLLRAADAALYVAKQAGRNQVAVAQPKT
ncbi:MAG TPA: diguanylate cyclase, partial [Anaerolineales bacterium]|nr:diguanylate cyclase [Anaerolineales bacterium]